MKYVKFFEEFVYEETKELIKFCKENLAYLIDDVIKLPKVITKFHYINQLIYMHIHILLL
jgi:hypothetical protein